VPRTLTKIVLRGFWRGKNPLNWRRVKLENAWEHGRSTQTFGRQEGSAEFVVINRGAKDRNFAGGEREE